MKPPNSSNNLICLKCGKIGHLSKNCTQESPNLSTFQDHMENEIITIYENAKGKSDTYQVDEFGPYVPAKEPEMNANSSWQNYDFCVNCGRKGHKTSECKDPTFDDMREQLNEISTDPNGNTPEKREQLFGEILKKSQNS